MGFFTYLDRNNLAFAAFQFKADLHISNSIYGLGKTQHRLSRGHWRSLAKCLSKFQLETLRQKRTVRINNGNA